MTEYGQSVPKRPVDEKTSILVVLMVEKVCVIICKNEKNYYKSRGYAHVISKEV